MKDNEVRIVGGEWRSRRIRFTPRPDLRPTPDRVRETLFNWLGQDLTGLCTLDLFCGTGALSLESVSRGAALAVAVDRNEVLIRALDASAATMNLRGIETHVADAPSFLLRE